MFKRSTLQRIRVFSLICDRIVWKHFAVLLTAALTIAGDVLGSAKVGEPAPDFELRQTNGDLVTLRAFRGKVVLLSFFGYN